MTAYLHNRWAVIGHRLASRVNTWQKQVYAWAGAALRPRRCPWCLFSCTSFLAFRKHDLAMLDASFEGVDYLGTRES